MGSELPEDDEVEASDDEEAESGARKVKRVLDSKLPSHEEVREHRLTRLPYRSWCHHYVRGRGKEMNHERDKKDDEQGVPEYRVDYRFPGNEKGKS